MAEEILINVTAREVRIALLENGALQEVHIERSACQDILGNIYKGKVSRILPGIQAAFVDIGLSRAAFLHIKDIQATDKQDICDILQNGQELLVQVCKGPLGSKGARLTTFFTIAARYLVWAPGSSTVTVSQKIIDSVERERLLSLIKPEKEGGYIFRTAAVGVSLADIQKDTAYLASVWGEIKEKNKTSRTGQCVYEEIPMVLRVLRDFAGRDVEKIRVDQMACYEQLMHFAERYIPSLAHKIELYTGERPIFDIYSIEEEIQKALQRKVQLKSGGYLIFDQTEAMTTIDVNTGSYLGQTNMDDTIFRTNLEAVEVISRQVRLRNLGGIIIIDFIDMTDTQHQARILEMLTKTLAKDSVRTEISGLSNLGLVQMTRKRTRESLEHILCITCPMCQKRGSIKSLETLSYEIFRELKRFVNLYTWTGFLIVASENVVNYLEEEESALLAEWEIQFGRPIRLQAASAYMQEKFDILPMS